MLWVLTVFGVLGLLACLALAFYAQMLEVDQRSVRPISGAGGTAPWDWQDDRSDRPAANVPGVVDLGRRSAARAGFPGAWDDDTVEVRRTATGG
jgi:hypothetical protein